MVEQRSMTAEEWRNHGGVSFDEWKGIRKDEWEERQAAIKEDNAVMKRLAAAVLKQAVKDAKTEGESGEAWSFLIADSDWHEMLNIDPKKIEKLGLPEVIRRFLKREEEGGD
jgi:hypothetical protein